MSQENVAPTPVVASLLGPRLPADHGLGSLGLIMQLGGSIFMGFMGVMAATMVFATRGNGDGIWALFLILASGAVRSSFHRSAGSHILYGLRQPFKGIKLYIIIALAQSVLTLFLLSTQLDIKGVALMNFALLLICWPVTLAVVLGMPRFARYAEELPVPEDKGFEGASVLMVILGSLGVMVAALMVLMLLNLPNRALSTGVGIASLLMMIVLIIRSGLHVAAGQKGVTGASVDSTVEATNTYINFGFAASFIVGGILFIQLLQGMSMPAMMVVGALVYLLLAWPLALRRFFTERQFAELLAGNDAPVHRRAPDAGLTALGWLLLPMAVLGLSGSIIEALRGPVSSMGGMFDAGFFGGSSALVTKLGRSPWWAVGIAGLQLFAAIELIRMSDRYRIAASIYGAIAIAVTIYIYMPMFDGLPRMMRMTGGMAGMGQLMSYGPIAFALALPVITLILANRNIAPVAKARFANPPRPFVAAQDVGPTDSVAPAPIAGEAPAQPVNATATAEAETTATETAAAVTPTEPPATA